MVVRSAYFLRKSASSDVGAFRHYFVNQLLEISKTLASEGIYEPYKTTVALDATNLDPSIMGSLLG